MRLVEFFQGGAANQLSMSRLLMLMSWPPATTVLLMHPTETNLGVYLGAYVLGYVGGKIGEPSAPR